MVDFFGLLKKHTDKLEKGFESKKYWEADPVQFDKNALGPDGNYYDEEALFSQIIESDRERLHRLG